MNKWTKIAIIFIIAVVAWKLFHKTPIGKQIAQSYPWYGMGATPNPPMNVVTS